jgi:ferritin
MEDKLKRTLRDETPPPSKGRNPLFSEDCIAHLNYRIQQEEYSSRIYLAMSMWLNNSGYLGAAKLWKTYSEEEFKHADWAREYLLAMGVQPLTPKLEAPTQVFPGLPEIVQQSFDHELEVTRQCKELADMAFKKADHMLYTLCLQYVKEQVEEHSKFQDLKDKLVSFGTSKEMMFHLDRYLGTL